MPLSRVHPLPVVPHLHAVLLEEIEAAAGEAALEQDAVVVVGPVLDLGVLGQVGQDAAVGHAGLDLGVERPVEQGLAHGLLELVEAVARARR